MGVVEKRGEGIERLGETEGARRATGVFPSTEAGGPKGTLRGVTSCPSALAKTYRPPIRLRVRL